jgi:myo-inositol-1(or 4)-monophosphatase
MDDILFFTISLAHQAGKLLVSHYRADKNTRFKSDRSLVTDADLDADRLITQAIRETFPSDLLLSEELNPDLEVSPDRGLWVIDPLDGTTNFSLGLPFWGVSIAHLMSGMPDIAVLYFPLLEDLFVARLGQGATLNANPLVVQPPDPDKPWSFFSCCSRTYRDYDVSIKYKPRILGSAAYSICSVASGMALISFDATPKIWDIAAAWLVVQESGGAIETYDDSLPFPVVNQRDYSQIVFPTLAASTPELLKKARGKIIKK